MVQLPASTPLLTQLLSPPELEDHRAQIGFEVEIVLSGYWQSQPSNELKAGIIADWMDDLEEWHLDQIRWALRKWRSTNPSRKPNPGHIVAILKGERGKTFVAQRDGKPHEQIFQIDRSLMIEAAE